MEIIGSLQNYISKFYVFTNVLYRFNLPNQNRFKMKTPTTIKKILTVLFVFLLIASCNQKEVDPNVTLDEVFIPAGYAESAEMPSNMEARLQELKLNNPEDEFYYLKFVKGPASEMKDLMFPQKELKIEEANVEYIDDGAKYHGVIVKKISGKWTDEIFMGYCDKKAEPKGGMTAFKSLTSEKLIYPETAKENKVEGRVFIQFIVCKDGTLTEVKAVKGIGAGCDEEAERFFKNETSWIPAQVANENVNSRMVMPVTFKLN